MMERLRKQSQGNDGEQIRTNSSNMIERQLRIGMPIEIGIKKVAK